MTTLMFTDVSWGIILTIIFLVLFSGFFSGTETSLTAASRPLLHALERRGRRRATQAQRLLDERERVVSALLLSNNLVNVLASALATLICVRMLGDRGVVIASLVMTIAIMLFGEVIPKTYALRQPNRSLLSLTPAVRFLVMILTVPVWIVERIAHVFLHFLPSNRDESLHAYAGVSDVELRGAIDLHFTPGSARSDEGHMLRSVLDLSEIEVQEIMVHRKSVGALDVDLPPQQILSAVLSSPHTRLPLWHKQADNVIGVLHAKNVLHTITRPGYRVEDFDARAIATPPCFVPENRSLLMQLREFRRLKEHFAVVVDEYGEMQGIVTLEDILEEIVGDIDDEHDHPLVGIRRDGDGRFLINGTVTLRDLNRQLHWDLPCEQASTLAGLILHEARRIPSEGQVFVFYGITFEIVTRRRNQLTLIRAIPGVEASS